ncbi:MAG: transcription factor S [Candidatus Nanohaloarchaea archaeon]|nr:transcription factor S [Candidatus Nanohaloarchaea archaeon]
MDFCDDCGGIIVSEKEGGKTSFKCRSCDQRYEKQGGQMQITETKDEEERGLIAEGSDEESLPETEEQCEECGNDTAYWWMEQTRAADEPETRFFKCTECGHTWREYD